MFELLLHVMACHDDRKVLAVEQQQSIMLAVVFMMTVFCSHDDVSVAMLNQLRCFR